MKLGFSTGCLWRDVSHKKALKLIRDVGCNSVELGLIRYERFQDDWLGELAKEDFTGFDYVSLHGPKIMYGKNKETDNVLKKLVQMHALRPLDCIVIHPDIVQDFSVFVDIDLPIAFENMDNRKKSFQTPQELDELTRKYGFSKFVLDVNHIFTIDPTMRLAQDFYDLLGDRIIEVQVSGYETLHDPLVTTQQAEIVRAIRDTNIPIIDEAPLKPNMLKAEKDFIETHLPA